jgi:cytochrome c-type biogenesis protein CcmH/NrfG
MATTHLQPARPQTLATGANRFPILWRDPQSVAPADLARVIAALEQACAQHPASADLRTCLGMAHAMNYDPYRSMDALEQARQLDPGNFLAQFKYAELHYRLRALIVAESETQKALDLADSHWELAVARHQLAEIRRLKREGTQKPAWTKSLALPAIALASMMALICYVFTVLQ